VLKKVLHYCTPQEIEEKKEHAPKHVEKKFTTIKLLSRRLKTKWSSLWVVKEIKTDENIEIESPYSRRIKVLTR